MIDVKITGTADTIIMLRDFETVVQKIAEDQSERTARRAHNAVTKLLTTNIAGLNDFVGPIPYGTNPIPHARTGALAASIFSRKVGEYTYRIGTPLDYGKMLEYGTRDMSRRPWLVKTVMKYRKQFFSGMNARIRQAATNMGVQGARVRFR